MSDPIPHVLRFCILSRILPLLGCPVSAPYHDCASALCPLCSLVGSSHNDLGVAGADRFELHSTVNRTAEPQVAQCWGTGVPDVHAWGDADRYAA